MTQPLTPEREHEIRSLDFTPLIRDNDEHTAAGIAVTAVCDLLNEIDRLRREQRRHRDQVLTEAASLITTKSNALLDEIDEDDRKPSDWERHQEWCDAADLLLAARSAQPTQE